MATKKAIREDLDYLTELLSKRVRELAAGVLAFCWLFLFKLFEPGGRVLLETWALLVPTALALSALACDLLQYWFGYFGSHSMYRKMTKKGLTELAMNEKALSRRLRGFFFYAKQLLILVAVIWVVALIGARLADVKGGVQGGELAVLR